LKKVKGKRKAPRASAIKKGKPIFLEEKIILT
jgi:hypothetical protein